jgi:dipeptidyl-peptidase-4
VQIDESPLPEREIHFYTREGHQRLEIRRAFPGEATARFRIGVVDVASGRVRFLDRPDDRDYIWNYGITADGGRVFVNGSDRLVKHHRIDVYEVDSGQAHGVLRGTRSPAPAPGLGGGLGTRRPGASSS